MVNIEIGCLFLALDSLKEHLLSSPPVNQKNLRSHTLDTLEQFN